MRAKGYWAARVSDDNPFFEAYFHTLKYQPDYPGRFRDIALARTWCSDFFRWYNAEHHHDGLTCLRLRRCLLTFTPKRGKANSPTRLLADLLNRRNLDRRAGPIRSTATEAATGSAATPRLGPSKNAPQKASAASAERASRRELRGGCGRVVMLLELLRCRRRLRGCE